MSGMSVTPRQAAFLAELFAPIAEIRTAAILAHVGDPVAAASVAVGPHVRARLADPNPAVRLAAAEYLWRVSGDPQPAVAELCDLCDCREVQETRAAVPLFALLGKHAAEPLAALARNLPDVFAEQPDDFVMWAASTVLTSGEDAPDRVRRMLAHCPPAAAALVMMELATLAPRLDLELDETEAVVRGNLEHPLSVHAAGAALWRLTWRVNPRWLAILPRLHSNVSEKPDLLALLTRVTVEHLGRRPDLAPLARAFLVRLGAKAETAAAAEVSRLAKLGGRGWGVLLLALQDSPPTDPVKVPPALRAAVLREALTRPALFPLVHHHAHRVLFDRAADPSDARNDDIVAAAADLLAAIGPPAASAFPDILRVIGRDPHLGPTLVAAAMAVVPAYPLPVSATIRALVAVPANAGRAAFAHLAGVLFRLDPDAGPGLVSQTTVPDHVVAQVLDSGHWCDLPADVRKRHAAALADLLASPRKDVRQRAAFALRRYLPELPAVWPALVAALATADDRTAETLLPCARLLAPVADAAAAELLALFAEPKTELAARAGVALWRLGRWAEVAPRLREDVARAMLRRAATAHGLHDDVAERFDGTPLAADARTPLALAPSLLDPFLAGLGSDPLDAAKWASLRDPADSERMPIPPLFVLAVMSAFGTGEFAVNKIWMIKHHRAMTRIGLAESKRAVERAMDLLSGGRNAEVRAEAVRVFFPAAVEIPDEIRSLIDSPKPCLRWAGLELADAWGLRPHEVLLWVEDRRRDASPLVRARAARM
jgi:hypothetical protein